MKNPEPELEQTLVARLEPLLEAANEAQQRVWDLEAQIEKLLGQEIEDLDDKLGWPPEDLIEFVRKESQQAEPATCDHKQGFYRGVCKHCGIRWSTIPIAERSNILCHRLDAHQKGLC